MGTHPPRARGAAGLQGSVSTCTSPPSSPSWSTPPPALDEPCQACLAGSLGCPLASSIWWESDSQANRDQASGESLASVWPICLGLTRRPRWVQVGCPSSEGHPPLWCPHGHQGKATGIVWAAWPGPRYLGHSRCSAMVLIHRVWPQGRVWRTLL
jgi:hypothetical protein